MVPDDNTKTTKDTVPADQQEGASTVAPGDQGSADGVPQTNKQTDKPISDAAAGDLPSKADTCGSPDNAAFERLALGTAALPEFPQSDENKSVDK